MDHKINVKNWCTFLKNGEGGKVLLDKTVILSKISCVYLTFTTVPILVSTIIVEDKQLMDCVRSSKRI